MLWCCTRASVATQEWPNCSYFIPPPPPPKKKKKNVRAIAKWIGYSLNGYISEIESYLIITPSLGQVWKLGKYMSRKCYHFFACKFLYVKYVALKDVANYIHVLHNWLKGWICRFPWENIGLNHTIEKPLEKVRSICVILNICFYFSY